VLDDVAGSIRQVLPRVSPKRKVIHSAPVMHPLRRSHRLRYAAEHEGH